MFAAPATLFLARFNPFQSNSALPRSAIELRREKNIAENRQKMIELGLIEEKKPKRIAKKKGPAAPAAPTRQSTRKRAAVKYTDDADWE